jgi:hypothetical protein
MIPPWEKVEQVAEKIRRDKVPRVVVITKHLLPGLLALEISPRITFVHTEDLFFHRSTSNSGGSGSRLVNARVPPWNHTYALLCSGLPDCSRSLGEKESVALGEITFTSKVSPSGSVTKSISGETIGDNEGSEVHEQPRGVPKESEA